VFALNATTGAVKWTYNPADMPPLSDLSISSGQCNRGVAVGSGKVFIARLDAILIGLDAATGKEAWRAAVDRWQDGYTETMAPLYVDGMVIVGTSGGEFLRRGHVTAYDANTGRQIWRFYTVPATGEFGNDTWAGQSWRSGGATVWGTPVADTALGLLYVGTGQPSPDENGSQRAGNNLFSDSIVALDLATGQRRWHFQELHHDLWDYDSVQSPHLFTMIRNGQSIPAVGHATKAGYYFLFDRRNGTPLYDITETPVPSGPAWQNASPTQPIPATDSLIPRLITPSAATKGFNLGAPFTVPQEVPYLINPGFESGPQWTPSAYSPRTGMTYIAAGGYDPWVYHAVEPRVTSLGSTGQHEVPGLNGVETYGLIDAVDTTTGHIAWQIKTPQKTVTGVVVAGDLVFYGEGNGQFNAADARTGKVLWTFSSTATGFGGANGCGAVYTVNGRQYVIMAFGGNAPARIGGISPPGDALVAFALPQQGVTTNVVNANAIQVDLGAIPDANLRDPLSAPTAGTRVVELTGSEVTYQPANFVAMPGERISVHLTVPGDVPTQGQEPISFAVKLPDGPVGLRNPVMPGASTYFEFTAPGAPGPYEFFSNFRNERALGARGVLRVAPACTGGTTPCISASGIVNAASFLADAVAPNEIVTILGSGIGSASGGTNSLVDGVLGTSFLGTRVLFGDTPAPIVSVNADQIAALVPNSVAGQNSFDLVVETNGVRTAAATVSVDITAPAVFTINESGTGPAVVLNMDNSVNSIQNPSTKGSTIRLFVTGAGQSNPALADGQVGTTGTDFQTAAGIYILIGGRRAEITRATTPAAYPGVLQVEARIPLNVPSASDVPIVFAAGIRLSKPVTTIAIQ